MSLISGGFFAFLALTCAAYYLLPPRWQDPLLLAASLGFAAAAGPWTLGVLCAEAVVTYAAALLLERLRGRARTAALWGGIALLLAALLAFKYADLLAGHATALGRLQALGISFYTLMAIGYLADVHAGAVSAERSPVRFALFLSFFPHLSSGPIGRAGELLPQLSAPRAFDYDRFARGLTRMLWGYFKKTVIADGLALAADPVFNDPASFSGPVLVLAVGLFTCQLYMDFSGYSDIACGLGEMFGITLRENFARPFSAVNFSGFWSRWHISLSSWFQDYLFLPLAWADTSRLSAGRLRRLPPELCVAVVFMVSGLWHGNTWPYLAWGIVQAAYRVGEELLHRRFGKPKKHPAAGLVLAKRLGVLALWSLSLVLFRIGQQPAAAAADCLFYYRHMLAGWGALLRPALLVGQLRAMSIGKKYLLYMGASALLYNGVEHAAAGAGTDAAGWLRARRPGARVALYYLLALLILCFGRLGASSFIYFQY